MPPKKKNSKRSIRRAERRKWTNDEDTKLSMLIKQYGTSNWRAVASMLPDRSSKQCRERWINHLDPSIVKGKLTPDEWNIVVQYQGEFGNRWSEIAKLLPGRTPNQIKNVWHAISRRETPTLQPSLSLKSSPQSSKRSPKGEPHPTASDDSNSDEEEFILPEDPKSLIQTVPVDEDYIDREEELNNSRDTITQTQSSSDSDSGHSHRGNSRKRNSAEPMPNSSETPKFSILPSNESHSGHSMSVELGSCFQTGSKLQALISIALDELCGLDEEKDEFDKKERDDLRNESSEHPKNAELYPRRKNCVVMEGLWTCA